MARKASVRYWASRQAYCCHHDGKQVVLAVGPDDAPDGPTFNEACRAFGELTAGKPVASGPTVADVVGKYLEWARHHRQEGTRRIREVSLGHLCKAFGKRPVASLTAYEVEAWADKQRTARKWGDGTVTLTLNCVSACLRWAAAKGVIEKNPIGTLDKPSTVSRGLECVLSKEQQEEVISACRHLATREFVICLSATGCRPGELCKAEAKHYDASLNALVFQANVRDKEKRHKTNKTGKARVIYLSGQATEIVKRLIDRYPSGPLFRTPSRKTKGEHKGERWAWDVDGVVALFKKLRRKTGIKGLVAYSFRHTYAVFWLRARKPIEALAEVLGTSVLMIQRHYGHLADQRDYLKKLVDEMAEEKS